MSTTTTNYGLIKPELTDPANITVMNENWDKIDSELKRQLDIMPNVSGQIDTHNANGTAHNDIRTSVTQSLSEAKSYTDAKIASIPAPDVSGQSDTHNNSSTAHSDIRALVNGKANESHTHTIGQITNFPASMPASDVPSWAKQSTKPTYTASEVGAATTATYTATITTSWTKSGTYYYQDITVSGILATDNPIVDIVCGSDNTANITYSNNMCKVFRIVTSANSIRVWATESITSAFPIQLKVVR